MRTVITRLAELLGLCFIMSPISCALYYYEFIPRTDMAYSLVLLAATVIFITANVLFLRHCFFELHDRKAYYVLNYTAYGIFMLITVLVYEIFGQIPYAWMFNSLKLLAFSEFDFSSANATAVTHFVMLGVIALAPIGMDWIFDIPVEELEDEFEDEEYEDEFEEEEPEEEEA